MFPTEVFCATCGAANNPQDTQCFACRQLLQPEIVLATTQNEQMLRQRYHLLNRLGQGGMGSVYRAEDTELGNRLVAIKELSQKGLNQHEAQEAEESFKHEALLLASLMHPNLPRIYDSFAQSGRWYLVMDFIEGKTLEECLASRGGRLPWLEVVGIATQLCTVLAYLHTRPVPIIFRDLKPLNVMLTDNQQIYLIDFGIARLFKPGQARDTIAFGSPGYAAPEQYGKAQTTPSADIYSLGAMLHQMLTGSDPATTPFSFAKVPGAPIKLQQLLDEMLQLNGSQRIADAALVEQRLWAINREEERNGTYGSSIGVSAVSASPTPYYTPPPVPDTPSRPTPSAPIVTTSTPAAYAAMPHVAVSLPTTQAHVAWSVQSERGRTVCTYEGHTSPVSALAWSPDGRSVASSDDSAVHIWDSSSGQIQALYRGHSQKRWQVNRINIIGWSRARDLIAISEDDGVIQIWRAEPDLLTLLKYGQHKGKVASIGWSANGKLLASVSQNILHTWEPDTGKTLSCFEGHGGTIHTLDWSPDNTRLVIGNEDGSVEVVRLLAQNTEIESQRVYPKQDGPITRVLWSPDGTRIVSTDTGKSVQIWDVTSGRRLLEYTGHHAPVHVLDWSPDGHAIVSAGGDGSMQIWDVQDGRCIYIHPSYSPIVRAISWSPDGLYIASSIHNKVRVWSANVFI